MKKWEKRYERKLLEDLSDKKLDYIIIPKANWENIIPAIIIYRGWKAKEIISPKGGLISYLDNIKVEEKQDFPFLRVSKNEIFLIPSRIHEK